MAFEPTYNTGCNHLCLYLEYLPIDLKRYMDALGPGERLSPKLVKVCESFSIKIMNKMSSLMMIISLELQLSTS